MNHFSNAFCLMLLKASFSNGWYKIADRKPHLISNPLYRHFITGPHYLFHHGFTRIYFYDKFGTLHINTQHMHTLSNVYDQLTISGNVIKAYFPKISMQNHHLIHRQMPITTPLVVICTINWNAFRFSQNHWLTFLNLVGL